MKTSPSSFPAFSKLVVDALKRVTKTPNVFVTAVGPDDLYALYLASFPEGTNPLFKTKTEHECSCCKQFIRRAGNIVAVDDDKTLRTIWDDAVHRAPHPYDVVATAMRDAVLKAEICNLYRVSQKEAAFGAAVTRSQDKDGNAVSWDHFYTGPIPKHLQADSPDQVCGDYRTTVQVFTRGLTELTTEATDTVLSLIEANNLYRGEEHKKAVMEFQRAQRAWNSQEQQGRNIFAWTQAHGPAARFRNTVAGTLVQDLSEGVDVEQAVKSFETKVAPTNYKRTTAVISPKMIKDAMATIAELGLEPALERRFATIGDLSVRDVLWVDGGVKPLMKGGLADQLMRHAAASAPRSTKKDEDRAESIGLDDFMRTVLPDASSMEVMLKGEHLGNLMSLTAPVHAEPKQLFKWSNDFAWSYGGNVADSIKERVKKAGGKVDGCQLRVSLSWFNFDDLDLHVYEPKGGRHAWDLHDHIYFRNKVGWTGGTLDLDMNAGTGTTREAVENVVWTRKVPDGAYRVVVNNYVRREANDPGFVIEVECSGKLTHYSYNKGVGNQQNVLVVTLHMKDGAVERAEIDDQAVTPANVSQTKWGLTTEQYVKVNAVTLSPNYWGENEVGNKHTFFVLEGAKCDEPTRGIYNEFLHPRLEKHRKVFEVIGDKTKCQPVDGALSGLGFSSTKRDAVLVKVQQGKKQRLFNVQVGADAVKSAKGVA